ncbi:MAG: hypothetical protein M3130_00520 [Actinomycetota bacterium]|nr:hypothetical protein [Actinomycetota bacterium]
MSTLAALLAAATLLLLVPAASRTAIQPGRRRPTTAAPLLVLGSVTAAAALSRWLGGTDWALTLIGATAGLGGLQLVRRSRHAAMAQRRTDQVLLACDSIASDLAAGQPSGRALDRVGTEWAEFASVAAAGHLGADVPGAMRDLACRPGAGALVAVAAAWQVAHRSGTGLADAITTAGAAIREERTTTRLVAAELASAHATARLLAVLPVGVLLLGAGVGGDPVGFLLGTPMGLACLASGLALGYCGMVWMHRLADAVLDR